MKSTVTRIKSTVTSHHGGRTRTRTGTRTRTRTRSRG